MKKLLILGILIAGISSMFLFPHTMLNPGELVAGHQELNGKCLACHNPFYGISNEKCIACHKLSDIGKDSLMNDTNAPNEKPLFHKNLSNQKCASCHTDHKGVKPEISLSSFDHEMLTGIMVSNCNSCHVQPPDTLHKQVTTTCRNCHNTKDWKSSVLFNHDMIQGENKNNCTSCHKSPDDTFHQQTKDNCNKCHSTAKWKPSTFDHSTYFLLDRDHDATCNTCHVNNNLNAYTCYGCHEHSEGKILEEHNEHDIYNFSNCVSCHKSANKHDIRMNEEPRQESNQNELNKVRKYIRSMDKDNKKNHEENKDHEGD